MAGEAAAAAGRKMPYPYTLGAQFMQFPFKYYYNNSWVFKSWVWGVLLTIPVMAKITMMSSGSRDTAKKESGKGHH